MPTYPSFNDTVLVKSGRILVVNGRSLVSRTAVTPDVASKYALCFYITFNGGNNSVAIGNFKIKDRYNEEKFHPTFTTYVTDGLVSEYYYSSSIVEDPSRTVRYTSEEMNRLSNGGSVYNECVTSMLCTEQVFTPTFISFSYVLAGGGRNDKFNISAFFGDSLIAKAENLMPLSYSQTCILLDEV